MARTEDDIYADICNEVGRPAADLRGAEVEHARRLTALWTEMAGAATAGPDWARTAARTLAGRYSAEAVEYELSLR